MNRLRYIRSALTRKEIVLVLEKFEGMTQKWDPTAAGRSACSSAAAELSQTVKLTVDSRDLNDAMCQSHDRQNAKGQAR